ncbi:MAG TPA: MFS transporter [Jatrophihabitantaceae bacterium]|nr:MFS transporter [Jatrophihabitantaceae bacterium]
MSEPIRLGTAAGRGVLATTILGSGMVFLDSTIANVATRKIGEEFNAGFGALQWVQNGYLLPLASLILLGGSLGDRLGRRRVFLIGVAWFAGASLLCAVAPNIEILIAARALQGVGGALLTPGSLAIISASFAPDDRAAAVGAWSGLGGVATAIGPFLGGWLVQDVSWRWAFAINLPFAVAVIFLGMKYVPETRAVSRATRLDIPGTLLVAGGLGALTYGTTTAGSTGWHAEAWIITAVGLALLAGFVIVERDEKQPLVPLGLFANRAFSGANIMTFMTYGALGAVLFVLVLHLQISAGYGALAAGTATLPITILMMFLSARSGALAARIGPRLQMIAGPLICAAGLLLTLRIDTHHHNYLTDVLPGLIVFGLGLSTFVAPLTATVMGTAPPDQVGVASGVNNAVARAASLLAVAILPPLAGLHGDSYRNPDVMVHGYRVVTLSSVVMLVAAAVVVAMTVRIPTRALHKEG